MIKSNFALVGVAGYIAGRHLKAIKETNSNLIATLDPHDCVGRLDSLFPSALFFTEVERFELFLNDTQMTGGSKKVDYLSICSPNYLHESHINMALSRKINAICEKPLVINPSMLSKILDWELIYGVKVFPVLQMRLHPKIKEIKNAIAGGKKYDVVLTYITPRGPWYEASWKGDKLKSGGLAINIGVHLFDILIWLFGPPERNIVHLRKNNKLAGFLELECANVKWFLSVDCLDLPGNKKETFTAYRNIIIDGESIDFSEGTSDLHTEYYKKLLSGDSLGIRDAQPSLEVASIISEVDISYSTQNAHPFLRR